ncbi:NADH dehydrogenase [ubiquinone] 1 beta subcomplex subunit 5, mitochondrial [Orussus abietinus]|uniref:NADH dehydrogenase [ubiquinone] 1 beta subcomplex subunit 5, mitochondrial n=1 Tax=Orussus abietinus TaxID=222816 RepID=UPI000626C5D3|nr:NADH dehydrogenase [ubiquinone] 1 beta subcomplex subunit 5, mitochondrial [Orussus abietinus]
MAGWSSLVRPAGLKLFSFSSILPKQPLQCVPVRCMSEHRTMPLTPTRWQWHKTKDLLHLYTLVGLIPIGIIIFCANVFVGPATLEPIPEGYTPKHWEYYRSPITRFLARYVYHSPQQDYELYAFHMYEQTEIMKIKLLQKKIVKLIEEREDYKAFYYRPAITKYIWNQRPIYTDADKYRS